MMLERPGGATRQDDETEGVILPDTRRLGWWAWTVCLVLLALMAGGFAGYYLRPALDGAGPANDRVPSLTRPGASGVAAPPSSLMEAAVGRTRHWKGEANASVTIIEFGDFQ
jgi:hypothetical protein